MTNKPHHFADLIHQWADGAIIECRGDVSRPWVETAAPSWVAGMDYRIKPAEPEYPQTMMSNTELRDAWYEGVLLSKPFSDHQQNAMYHIANTAIKRAIQYQQVYLPPSGDEVVLLSQSNGQDFFSVNGMRHVPINCLDSVALRVYNAACDAATKHYEARTGQSQLGTITLHIELAEIIASVVRDA